MTSRSTVTQPAGRDVGSAYQIETPPASPRYRDVNATEWSIVGSGASTSQDTLNLGRNSDG